MYYRPMAFLKIHSVVLLFVTIVISKRQEFLKNVETYVDLGKEVGPFRHFWESTGLCPPLPHQKAYEYFLSKDMVQNIMQIGSVPHSGIKQVRMHWLLDMVTYNETSNLYNFSNLDILLTQLNSYGLRPGFELMGSPSDRFDDFDDVRQVREWMSLVTTLAQRYVKMFGLDEVSLWNFETWNEPDHRDFDNVTMSVEGFLKYYDACSEGLKAVDESLVFGGPGGSCRKESFSKRCWALLEHCVSGKNYITGEKGSRIDYIAMHKKGAGSSEYILQTELKTIEKIHTLHPSLVNVSIFNDEGDPMVGWSHPYEWRGDVTYPAMVVKIIAQHQSRVIANKSSNIVYSLLSNDNGFLSYNPNFFTQRTLTSRFQINNTYPHYVHLVRKTILSVMGMLAKLGNVQLPVFVPDKNKDEYVGTLASIFKSSSSPVTEITLLTYASSDTSPYHTEFNVSIHLKNLNKQFSPSDNVKIVKCEINNELTNPYMVWKNNESPKFPGPNIFIEMHKASEVVCTDPTSLNVKDPLPQLNFIQQLPGVTLHQICSMPKDTPSPPKMRSVHNITTGQVLITWDDSRVNTKCIQTYEVELCYDRQCTNRKSLNSYKVTFNSFVYIAGDKSVGGFYRVRVVDFWGRYSPFSDLYQYPSK